MNSPTLKLDAVHLVDDGVYLVSGKYGYSFEVDGLPAPKNDFVVQSLDSIQQVVHKRGPFLNYKNGAGETMTAEAYGAEVARLLEKSYRDSDGEIQFSLLDDEYAYRKFISSWVVGDREPDTIERLPVEVQVTEVRVNSGDPDIVSLWNSPQMDLDKTLYQLDRDVIMARTFYEACQQGNVKGDNENHTYLRFAKIEGSYAFNDSFYQSRQKFTGTLEQCKAEKAVCIKRVRDIVAVHVAKKYGDSLRNVGDVLIRLQEVQRNLQAVRVASKSTAASLTIAKQQLAKLIERIGAEV